MISKEVRAFTAAGLSISGIFIGASTPSNAETLRKSPEQYSLAAALLQDINDYRLSIGLPTLNENQQLDEIAQVGVQDMSDRNYRSHTSPTGKTIFTRLAEKDVKYMHVGEIIAWNGYPPQESEQVAFKAFIKDIPHRNIIEDNYTEIGIGSILTPAGIEIYEAILLKPEQTDQLPYVGKGPYVD